MGLLVNYLYLLLLAHLQRRVLSVTELTKETTQAWLEMCHNSHEAAFPGI